MGSVRVDAAEWGSAWWAVLDSGVWHDDGVIFAICHVIGVEGVLVHSSRVFKMERSWFVCLLIPLFIMFLSNQHPYALFVAGGLRSPSLAKVWIEVGDNTNTYFASADIVSFRPNSTALIRLWNSGQLPRWSLSRTESKRSGTISPLSLPRWMGLSPG